MYKYTVSMDTFSERIKQNSAVDRRITSEQIFQLCRMLTEQYKNKSLKNNQMDRSSSNEIQSEDISSSRSSEQDYCDRLSVDSEDQSDDNAMVLGDNNADCLSVPMIKSKHAKKDILNKIRNQIFERKRQKLASLQRSVTGVWRPWSK